MFCVCSWFSLQTSPDHYCHRISAIEYCLYRVRKIKKTKWRRMPENSFAPRERERKRKCLVSSDFVLDRATLNERHRRIHFIGKSKINNTFRNRNIQSVSGQNRRRKKNETIVGSVLLALVVYVVIGIEFLVCGIAFRVSQCLCILMIVCNPLHALAVSLCGSRVTVFVHAMIQ